MIYLINIIYNKEYNFVVFYYTGNMYFIKKVLSDMEGIVYLNNKFMYEDIKK